MKIKNGRKTRTQRWHSILVAILFLLILASIFVILAPAKAVELAEINPDDWNLELLFFDNTINNGKDPIVDEKWLIGESSKIDTYSRIITMQINYKNENIDRAYEPGELQIVVPNPLNNVKISNQNISVTTTVGANGASYNSYAWDYNYTTYKTSDFVFTNHDTLEVNANIEGSIQVVYTVNSNKESYAEEFDDSCTHMIDESGLKAVMNGVAESNVASFEYSRTYNHPWTKSNYNINTSVYKIQSYDGLGENADQYIWVKYRYYGSSTSSSNMNYSTRSYNSTSTNQQIIGLSSFRVDTVFPEGIKVMNGSGTILEHDQNYVYNMPDSARASTCGSSVNCYEIFVGYPKAIYNVAAGTNRIQNIVQLDGVYASETAEGTLATRQVDIDLSQFEFSYTGSGIGIWKSFSGTTIPNTQGTKPYYYDYISSENGQTGTFNNTVSVRYTGTKQTVRVGDDLLYYIDARTGTTQKLQDNDYYFGSVTVPALKNGNSLAIPNDKYTFSLFVRYRGNNSFEKYGDYSSVNRTITFDAEQLVQAWYIELYDLQESIQSAAIGTTVILKSTTLPTSGTLYNFNYVKVYQDGNFINPGALENYAAGITQDYVADYDNTVYGEYLQRSLAKADWDVFVIPPVSHTDGVGKSHATQPIYKPAEEAFMGSFYLLARVGDYTLGGIGDWDVMKNKMRDSDMNHFVKMYDLLPLGMLPDSTPEEIINSLDNCPVGSPYRQKNGEFLFSEKEECYSFVKEHTSVKITKNWHNTGRWHIAIHVDFSDRPFTTYNSSNGHPNAYGTYGLVRFTIKYRVPYDSYAEYGSTFKNTAWRAPEYQYSDINNNHSYDNDNGTRDPDVVDIDDNGRTDERMNVSDLNINLTSVTSTTQDLQISVLTDHSGTYELNEALSGHGEDYVYKLRMRTGNNKVTNVVLYNHIEEKHNDNAYWKGSFDGVDTSFAESKKDYYDNPIKIKTYWSPKANAGNLASDNTWQEYNEETTDKAQVRSLAFQYLDQEGNPALLTQSSYSYILVKMKAPEDENVNSFAYNNLHSEWNAIDNLTGDLIYNIVGIESNITRVYLSEKFDLKVTKVWDDYDNYYDARPDTISFTLYNGDELIETKEMNIANGESEIVFEQLNSLDQENYRVEEADVDGYIPSFTQDAGTLYYTFTNKIDAPDPSLNPQTTDANPWLYVAGGGVVVVIVGVGAVSFARRRA